MNDKTNEDKPKQMILKRPDIGKEIHVNIPAANIACGLNVNSDGEEIYQFDMGRIIDLGDKDILGYVTWLQRKVHKLSSDLDQSELKIKNLIDLVADGVCESYAQKTLWDNVAVSLLRGMCAEKIQTDGRVEDAYGFVDLKNRDVMPKTRND